MTAFPCHMSKSNVSLKILIPKKFNSLKNLIPKELYSYNNNIYVFLFSAITGFGKKMKKYL